MANLTQVGVVPVVRAESPDNVVRAVEALLEGGIPVAEITLTVRGRSRSSRAAARISASGSPRSRQRDQRRHLQRVIDAGSVFVVTPVLQLAVIDVCKSRGVCAVTGALTPPKYSLPGRPARMWSRSSGQGRGRRGLSAHGARASAVHPSHAHRRCHPGDSRGLFQSGVPFVGAGGDLVNKASINSGTPRRSRKEPGSTWPPSALPATNSPK